MLIVIFADEFKFIENDLFFYLNNHDNTDGKIILGTYKNTGKLELERLIDLVILKSMRVEEGKF